MLGDIRQAKNVYIVTGYTDMRKGIRSLVPYVMQNFKIKINTLKYLHHLPPQDLKLDAVLEIVKNKQQD